MTTKSLSPLMISAFLLAASLFGVSTAFDGRKALAPAPDVTALAPGSDDLGFVVLNTKDPKVIALAKFAVDEYNKEKKANLVFNAVLEAISSTNGAGPQGTSYGLVVAATTTSNDKQLNAYSVKVVVDKNGDKLVRFDEDQ